MYNKKNYNNLFESICCVLLWVLLILIYSILIYFTVISPAKETNPIAALIISTVVFGLMIITITILIIKKCFSYWKIDENQITSKKLFDKKIVIRIKDIKSIQKKVVPYLIFGLYRSEAYIINDEDEEIVALVKKRTSKILENLTSYVKDTSK